ncbi:MAG: beta-propeller domain-containing protein, partial [Erysipelotrichaceae bacterium]
LLIAQYRYVVTNQATGEGKTVTDILRFDVNSLQLKADASISGYLLNQFSFDVYDSTIRVAATDWSSGKTTNAVYVFNMALEPQSSIMNLAAGETIRAVRFIGDKGYVVTFQNIDPLFVIDLSNPKAIKVTGELKVPGFSTYLHPLSKNVLFGIAEDLVVVPVTNPDGTKWNSMTRYGIKISLFDVSDPAAPKELASLRVLGQNGYTEASYNHKTIVYDKERELLYLPYTDSDYTTQVCQTYPGKEGTGDYTYCNYKMESGIKVLHITATDITLVKTIVVATNNDYTNLVSRVLYVGDKLYAITSDSVLIFDRDSYAPISTIKY